MATVVIVDYDPSWPDQFEQLAAALRRRLNDGVVSIDHIGSTAVPGLAAKDIIDLQVTVASLADADRMAPALQLYGAPSDTLVELLQAYAEPDVSVTFMSLHEVGFTRASIH